MDTLTLIVVGIIFCTLIVSVFMVAYRYNAMSREMTLLAQLIKKLGKSQSAMLARFSEESDKKEWEVGPTDVRMVAPSNDAAKLNTELLHEIIDRLDDVDVVLAEHLAGEGAVGTIPPTLPRKRVENESMGIDLVPPHEESVEEQAVSQTPKKLPRKTAVRCPACSRQLPYDALRIQDEQTCPYCAERFRSNEYLLSLINDGATKHKTK